MRRVGVTPSLEGLFVAAFALLGVRLGATPIADNSAFWHIRTGIDMVAGRGVPTADPYSWTAAGHPWVVQSWLAEGIYGAAHWLHGYEGIVVLNAMLLGSVAGLSAALARAGSPRRTLVAAGLATAVGVGWWSLRPLLFGLVLLGATIFVTLRSWRAWWLIPLGALWVNVHGSFVLGLAWLGLSGLGALFDRRDGAPQVRDDAARIGALAAGVAVGALISPVGWRLLTFPFGLLERREAFAAVIEWQRPDFFGGRVQAMAGLALLATAAVLVWRRPPLRVALPAAAFIGAALLSQRNMAPAGLAIAPALAAALGPLAGGEVPAGREAELEEAAGEPAVESAVVNRAVASLLVVAGLFFLAAASTQPALDLRDYPVAAVRWMEAQGLRQPGSRVVHTDVVGGWLILRDGRQADVFIDDRVDMYPLEVQRDYLAMLRDQPQALEALDRRQVDVVLWPADGELSERLVRTAAWKKGFE
ncbi:MAG: hypothetical protein ACR2H3_13255, partial [Acidimicrobiales bacterium]